MEPTQELKSLVDGMGTAFEEFKSSHGTLKSEIKNLGAKDVVLEEKLNRIAEDIATKHEAAQKRYDELQARLARPSQPSELEKDERKQLADFDLLSKTVGKRTAEVTVEEYRAYTKAFNTFLRKGRDFIGPDELKAMSVGSDPDGGYWVRPQYSSRIIDRMFETSPMRGPGMATVETISTDELVLSEDPNEATVGWVGESSTRSNSATPQIGQKKITAHELYSWPPVSQRLLEDAAVNVEMWLTKKVGDKFSRTESTAFISGTGVSQPRGILSHTAGTTWGTVEQVNSGTNGAFTYTGLLNLITSLKEPYHANAVWLIRRQSIASIMLLTAPDSSYIFQPIRTGNFNETPLLGYPIRYATDMPAIATNALSAAFGDFTQGYTIVDRVGVSVLRDPYTSTTGDVIFKHRKRVGGDVVDFDAYKIQKLAA